MGKQGGLGQRLLVGGYDISGDIQALDNVHGGPALQDVTDITQSAHARLGLLRDGGLGASAFFDAANAHPVLSSLPVADVQALYLLGTTLGAPAACCVAKQIGYDPNRSAAGDLLLKTQFDSNGFALEWGIQATPGVRTDTAATNGADLDNGASSAFGAQAYLQVTAFTGTDATVKVQHSADNSTWSDLITFTQVTAAPASQRLAVSGTVDRYVRVSTVTTGGFTSATFAVAFARNPVAVSF